MAGNIGEFEEKAYGLGSVDGNAVLRSTEAATVAALTASAISATSVTVSLQKGLILASIENAITAHAGGGQASGYALTKTISRVTIVGSAADSVKLPAATAGAILIVENIAAANSMNVYGQSGEAINAIAADSPLAVAANKRVLFFCAVAGTWGAIVTA